VKTGALSAAGAGSTDRTSKARAVLIELLTNPVRNQHELAHGDSGTGFSSQLLEEDSD
jgi:hypothetical protein